MQKALQLAAGMGASDEAEGAPRSEHSAAGADAGGVRAPGEDVRAVGAPSAPPTSGGSR
jgi:hypothetical protein